MTGLIIGALYGITKEQLLSPLYSPVANYWEINPLTSLITEVAMGSYKRRNPPDIEGTGYVVRSLEAALWAFDRSDSFEEGCLLAVNLGHDADTTAAIYGQLAGAFYGEDAIPFHWRQKIVLYDTIIEFAEKLLPKEFLSKQNRNT